jgi:nucleoside-diphosphate-sugar epimerase
VRVLISGAAGFIGSHLAVATARNRHDVVALMRRNCSTAFELQKRIRIETADLAVEAQALPAGPFDALIHCAAAIPSAVPIEAELTRINIEGSRRLFEHVLTCGAKLIVFCSSMAVYGRIDADVVDRDTPINEPSAYGRSKLASEEKLSELCRGHSGLRALSIRLPGVVGPASHDNFLSETLRRFAAGESVSVRNPNALFNNVVHIDDLARFAASVLETLPPGHGATTIGAVEPLPIREVVGILQIAAAPGAAIRYREEGHSFLISNEHARTLGYRPATVRDAVERFAVGWKGIA